MRSELQVRAQSLLERFRKAGRSPIVVEFAGLPKSGKTTVISQIHTFLRRCGFRAEVVIERASVCPIRDKKHSSFNTWTSCTALSQLLDKTQVPPRPDDPEILILDRGLFDAVLWLEFQKLLSRIRRGDAEKLENFLLMEEWRRRISAVIVMKASPEDSLKREQGHLPVDGDGGSIMNLEVLTRMHHILIDTVARIRNQFRIYEFDTSAERYNNKQTVTCEAVASAVLDVIEIELNEKILSLKKERLFEGRRVDAYLNSAQATEILDLFHKAGEFERREVVEADTSRVQALPIVIVRNKSGQILRLVRRERDDSNALHGKTVIWAGGHVRQEDGADGRSAILWGAVRELNEELRLMVEPDSLELKGAVYVPSTERSAQHMAMLYEWCADSDAVEIALCRSEFFERQGNSVRGDFVSASEIIEEAEKGGIDDWSRVIVNQYLAACP